MAFETNVFVNCPFDSDYLPLLRPLLFTVIDLGFTPRIALESLDSGAPRIGKIISLIKESKFAIHDLSRIEAKTAGEYFRLNMPFELGIDVGCRLFKRGRWSNKRCLILETERYRYQAAISDMSNSDIGVHGNDPVRIVSVVRNWLNAEAALRAPGPARVLGRFTDFMGDNYVFLKRRGFSDSDIDNLSVAELIGCMQEWTQADR
jgi:hypothetical protein